MKRLLMPMAVSAAAWLLVACGGGGSDSGGATERVQGVTVAGEKNNANYRQSVQGGNTASRIDPRLRSVSGPVTVWVSLDQNSVAAQRVALAERAGLASMDGGGLKREASLKAAAQSHRQYVRDTQESLVSQLKALGGVEVARVQIAHNAVAIRIDAAQLASVASLQGVLKVRPVVNYELTLSETVPYVGATAVQQKGIDGTGVTVAVLDSGIDYTHKNLGGAGTAAAYEAAYGTAPGDARNTTRDGLFPTSKVIGGRDFVGEDWPNTPEAEDDDPIDFEGHGTHVADIIAGQSADGTHKGVAPGAKLLAVKVCSAVATSCSGIALLKGVDYALDPNGDGDTSDAVDVMNLSLGSNYGQVEDDLTAALQNAVDLGVVVVAAAGNAANRPYIVSSPSIGQGVISVAQTAVPSAVAIPLVVNAPAAIAGVYGNTATVEWAPIEGSGASGDVVYMGRGCPGDPILADPAGKIALILRGACAVSLKVDNAATRGAKGVLIGLVAGGDAVSFSYGGGTSFVPTLVIQQSLSTAIRAQISGSQTVNVTLSPASAIPLVGSMATTSARGPSVSFQSIKPEIGAPGASISAEAGTGDGETAFGGTSGATPMVAGAAALLVQAYPNRSPLKIKAMLMNSAETTVYTNPALVPGELAPITRIGAGELRVDRALALTTIAWNRESKSAALSFGALEVSRTMVVEKTLRIENLGNTWRSYTVTPSFRYANDEASGAVKVLTRSRVFVGPRGREEIDVRLLIDPSKLPDWTLNGGSLGGDGNALNGPEYDGYITLTSGSEKVTVPWHVLPRKAADTEARLSGRGNPGPSLVLANRGAADGDYDVFSLLAISTKAPRSSLPKPGDNFAFVDLKAVGARYLADFDVMEFAISTYGRRAHPNYPAGFEVDIDTNGDGTADWFVFNAESGGFGVTGQNLVFLQKATATSGSAFFYTDADLNSGNVIMTIPFSALGVAEGTTMTLDVLAVDNYFTGKLTDSITGLRFTPGNTRFGVVGDAFGTVASRSSTTLGVKTATLPDTVSSEQGLLLMYRRNAGSESDAIRIR